MKVADIVDILLSVISLFCVGYCFMRDFIEERKTRH
jgi:hypothetical protein